MKTHRASLCLLSLGAFLLTACGSDDNKAVTKELVEINSAKVSLEPLKPASAADFSTYLKNGLYVNSIGQVERCDVCNEALAADANLDYSVTNNQVAGVNEADRIKYDGEHVYIAARPYYDPQNEDETITADYIKIMQRESDSSMSHEQSLTLPDNFQSVKGLYLNEHKLAAIGSAGIYGIIEPFDLWQPYDEKVKVAVYDVSTPISPELTQFISFDGYLLSSRQIDNKMYLVSSYSPSVAGINYSAANDEDKQQNFDLIQAMNINDLMPKISIGNGVDNNLVSPEDCFIPEDATQLDGSDRVVTLTTIDLTQPGNIKSQCVSSLTQDIYVSNTSLYLLGTNNEQMSVIHKFDLSTDLNYLGTGTVDGYFGWRNASFRLSEYQDKLRVVTSKITEQSISHHLFILDSPDNDKKLNVISQLPNETQPEPIGKPNEDIFAVRYFNEKAYIVTYEQIDPLYVLDLADVQAPKITGSLEIPGFSSYLHPINQNLLLGIGQQIDPNQVPDNGQNNQSTDNPIVEGAKVALFDVSDPSQPIELDEIVFANSYSTVQWDHLAFTSLAVTESEFRFTLPIETWGATDSLMWYSQASLQLLEVNISDSGAQLLNNAEIVPVNDETKYISAHDDRSILHSDDVYYIHGNDILHTQWQ